MTFADTRRAGLSRDRWRDGVAGFSEGGIDLLALEGDGTRSGKGSALLTRIMAIADEFGLEIHGNVVAVDTPARDAGLSDEALRQFYRRLGFDVWCGAEKLWHLRYCPHGAKLE